MKRSPANDQLILGLVGDAASGKDFVASIFTRYGFTHYSTSDVVREEIHARGLTTSRALQTSVANELRVSKGPSHFVEEALRRVNAAAPEAGRVMLSGLYAPAEGRYIIDELGGQLVRVLVSEDGQADTDIRFSRLARRADGSRDDLSHGDFMEAFERENGGNSPLETNVGTLMGMARFSIINSDSTQVEELVAQVEEIVGWLD